MTGPGEDSTIMPDAFVRQMQDQLGDALTDFLEALKQPVPVSVLLNTAKPGDPAFAVDGAVPWCDHGRYLHERPSFTLDPLFHAGAYYVMEASSMLLWSVISQLSIDQRQLRVLDLCAAPGGKSLVLLTALTPDSLLVANEVSARRNRVLQYNLAKWGRSNVVTTQLDPARIQDSGFFDCVLVDAPCSGEGLFRKSPDAIQHWSRDHVRHCSGRQQRILSEAARLLRPGGILIYSTCTYNPDENIRQIAWLHRTFGMTAIPLDFPVAWGISEVVGDEVVGYQCFPHRVRGEGFFVSAVRNAKDAPRFRPARGKRVRAPARGSDWEPWVDMANQTVFHPVPGVCRAMSTAAFEVVQETHLFARSKAGTLLGRQKGSHFIPDHMLALSTSVQTEVPRLELTLEQALSYLRRETPDVTCDTPGWALACYLGRALGWVKQTPGGMKNQLPMSLRIRMA